MQTGAVRVGVSVGPWVGAAEAPVGGNVAAVPIVSKQVMGRATFGLRQDVGHGNYRYRVSENTRKCQTRLVGVDRKGRIFEAAMRWQTAEAIGDEFTHDTTFEFDGKVLPLKDLNVVRLEARPFRYVTFEDVALYPREGAQ